MLRLSAGHIPDLDLDQENVVVDLVVDRTVEVVNVTTDSTDRLVGVDLEVAPVGLVVAEVQVIMADENEAEVIHHQIVRQTIEVEVAVTVVMVDETGLNNDSNTVA